MLSNHAEEVTTVRSMPQVALDDEVPASWPTVDVVKLSVNGAERDTLAQWSFMGSQFHHCVRFVLDSMGLILHREICFLRFDPFSSGG